MKSKEQTLTAEGLYDDKMGSDSVWKEDCVELMEQYAQYREKKAVLEALERLKKEISKGENVYNNSEILQLIEIEKTEVKQKYK